MSAVTLDSLEEARQIEELLEQIVPPDQIGLPSMPAFPAPNAVEPSSLRRRWSPTTLAVGTFLRKVNWINDDNYDPPRPDWVEQEWDVSGVAPATEARPLTPGSTPLRQFLQLVNWENREIVVALPLFDAPAEPKAPANGIIVENFFNSFNFD